jgi:hypothetical protein
VGGGGEEEMLALAMQKSSHCITSERRQFMKAFQV